MSASITLAGLSTREAIIDALYRAFTSLDTANAALFESALTQDATLDMHGKPMDGLPAIKANIYDGVSKLDTTHHMTNVRVDVKEGESTALVTCSVLAQHYRPGQGSEPGAAHLMGGSLHDLKVVKDKDGLWKVNNWTMKIVWHIGDATIMSG